MHADSSVAGRRQGDMAVSNAIGSNVFDILLGLGFPWLLAGLTRSEGLVEVRACGEREPHDRPARMDPTRRGDPARLGRSSMERSAVQGAARSVAAPHLKVVCVKIMLRVAWARNLYSQGFGPVQRRCLGALMRTSDGESVVKCAPGNG